MLFLTPHLGGQMRLLALLAMKINHKTKDERLLFFFFFPRIAECLVHQYAV